MFVDTIGALLPLECEVVAGEFDGEVRNVDLRTGVEQRRLFHNPRGEYAPRVTYWPGSAIKVEFSAQKMVASVEQALDEVEGFVRAKYGALPGVRAWKCQRVDYAYNFEVGDELPLYLAVVQELRLRSWARVPFAGSGVVWKGAGSRGRWVKFYTKHATEGILLIRQQVGPAEQSFFVDANNPVFESSDGKRSPRVIEPCPQCNGFIKLEKLYSQPPAVGKVDSKAPTGYIPARMGSDDPAK